MTLSVARRWFDCNLVERHSLHIAAHHTAAAVAEWVQVAAGEVALVVQNLAEPAHMLQLREAEVGHSLVDSAGDSWASAVWPVELEAGTRPAVVAVGEQWKGVVGTCFESCIVRPFRREQHVRLGQVRCRHDWGWPIFG